MPGQHALLLDGLGTHEAHRGLAHRYGDGLGVVAIVLGPTAHPERTDQVRRHQAHLVTITTQCPGPMMRRTTGLKAHQAWLLLLGPTRKGVRAHRTLQHHATLTIQPAHRYHALCQVHTHGCNLVHKSSPLFGLIECTHINHGTWMPILGGGELPCIRSGRGPIKCWRADVPAVHCRGAPARNWRCARPLNREVGRHYRTPPAGVLRCIADEI
jgi:hypothetical protein